MTDVAKDLTCESFEEGDFVSRYVTNQLPEADAEAFERHYLGCDRCSGELQAALELRAALSRPGDSLSKSADTVTRGPWSNRRLLAAAAAIGVLALSGVLLLSHQRQASTNNLAALVAAIDGSRLIEPRLTGGFRYAPLERAKRGSEEDKRSAKVKSAAYQVLESQSSASSAQGLHTAGIAHLLLGEWDEAVQGLQKAANTPPDDAHFWSDLAGAYLMRGNRKDTPQDFASALTAAEKALSLAPALPEALFNRALALEAMPEPREKTSRAWKAYLEVDSRSGWADEARQHLAQLEAPTESDLWNSRRPELDSAVMAGDTQRAREIVSLHPQQAREYAGEELLPEWAEAFASGDRKTADRRLNVCRQIGGSLRQISGELLIEDSVKAIDESLRRGSGLASLIEGHRAYKRGRDLYKKRAREEAAVPLQSAEESLAKGGSPFRLMARLYVIVGRFAQRDPSGCIRELNALSRTAGPAPDRYPALRGLAGWVHGLSEFSLGHPNEALEEYRAALSDFERLHERENTASLHGLLAELLSYLGDSRGAWDHRKEAIALLRNAGETRRLYPLLQETARAALQEGNADFALRIHDSMVSLASDRADPILISDAFLWRSVANRRRGNLTQAREDLDHAAEYCEQIASLPLRSRTEADIRSATGAALGPTDSRAAMLALDAAIEYFDQAGDRARLPEAYLSRGRLHLSLREDSVALQDFNSGIREIESQRGRVPAGELRISYFETARALFDGAVGLLADGGRAEEAFDYAERARARSLLDDIRGLADAATPEKSEALRALELMPLTAAEIRKSLPDGVSVVGYLILERELLIWTLGRDVMSMTREAASRERLESLVASLRAGIVQRNQTDWSAAASELYDTIFKPVSERVGKDVVVFLPDKALNDVPFAALRSSETGRFLIQDRRFALAPSATFFIRASERANALGRSSAVRALIVGSPDFDRRVLPGLPPLPQAAAEAARLAGLYRGAVLLTGASATASRFLSLAGEKDLIHFAGHALVNTDHPLLSALVLAPEPATNGTGLLYAHEISARRFPTARLVVLGACDTVRGHGYANEGVLSLARAFLAAGVPDVIGSLWQVEDDSAARVSLFFHQNLQAGKDPVSALQLAQVSLLTESAGAHGSNSWAAFQLIGGLELPNQPS